MVAPETLYIVTVSALLLFALAVSVPVLLRIFREGRDRQRRWRSGEGERYAPDAAFDRVPGGDEAVTDPDRVRCRNCGTVNEAAFRYCEQCGERL